MFDFCFTNILIRKKGGLNVPHALELTPHPALLQAGLVLHGIHALRLRVPCGDLGVDCLSGQHCALHGGVSSLDLRDVHEASAASDETAAREGKLGDTLISSLIESTGSIAY